jgi:hypothetical protein
MSKKTNKQLLINKINNIFTPNEISSILEINKLYKKKHKGWYNAYLKDPPKPINKLTFTSNNVIKNK